MRVVVVGTGTEVGKTFVAKALCRGLRRSGLGVVGLKPVESGLTATGRAEDAHGLAQAAGAGPGTPLYGFDRPVSPHLEARREGVAITLDEVSDWVAREVASRWAVIETAGGLLSPLGVGVSNLDLAEALQPNQLVLVAANRLGVLHDVAAVAWVLRARGWWSGTRLVLSNVPPGDASSASNAAELVALGVADEVVTVDASVDEVALVQELGLLREVR